MAHAGSRLLILLCGISLSHAQSLPTPTPPPAVASMFTGGLVNGRSWHAFSDKMKTMYVVGIRDAIFAAAMLKDRVPPATEVHWAGSFSPEDYVTELDTLYQDTENIRIPVVLAVEHITYKLRGDKTRQEVETSLILLRKWIVNVN